MHRVVFAMRIAEQLSFVEYWRDPRFLAKRPTWRSGPTVGRAGDNVYGPLVDGGYGRLSAASLEERKAHDRSRCRPLSSGRPSGAPFEASGDTGSRETLR